MSETVTEGGVATAQKEARESATSYRTNSHSRHKKWVVRLVVAVVIFAILKGLTVRWKEWRAEVARDDAVEQAEKQAAREKKAALERAAAEQLQPKTVTVTEGCHTVQVTPGYCLRWWGDDPAGNAFRAEAIRTNGTRWIEWGEYKRMAKEEGMQSFELGFVRFCANGGNGVVHYRLYPVDSTCSKP